MRVLIAAPRKSGNTQLRCLLAAAYGLDAVGSRDAPPGDDPTSFAAWLSGLTENTVFHADCAYSQELADLASRHGVTLVAIIRHPYDAFVAVYDVAQHRQRKARNRAETADAPDRLSGVPIDDERILDYLRTGFADEVAWLTRWHDSGAPVIRLEQLEADPAAALTALAPALGPLTAEQTTRAIATCARDNVIYSPPGYGRRMAPVASGAWRSRLSGTHLAILRDRHAADVARLGYEDS
jgi:hypothetical protein